MFQWVDDKLAIMTARDNLSSIRFAWGVTEANAGGSSFFENLRSSVAGSNDDLDLVELLMSI